eukprot:scaffold25305_cov99-Isochrysis_galbana.AAC.3
MFPSVCHGSRPYLASFSPGAGRHFPCPSPFPLPHALSHRANRDSTLTVANSSRLPLCPSVSVSRTRRLSRPADTGAGPSVVTTALLESLPDDACISREEQE